LLEITFFSTLTTNSELNRNARDLILFMHCL